MESHFFHSPHCLNLVSIPSYAVSACFWLVVAFFLISSHLRPTCVLFSAFICRSIWSHTLPPPSCLHSSTSPTAPPTIGLIVVSNHKTVATLGQGHVHCSIFWWAMRWRPNQSYQLRRRQTHCRVPCMDSWGDYASRVGTMMDVAMAI